jgi:hypothetical protein
MLVSSGLQTSAASAICSMEHFPPGGNRLCRLQTLPPLSRQREPLACCHEIGRTARGNYSTA